MKERLRILLVNPPIYDFSAYDFWLKPYGLLRVAGCLRRQADLRLFDYLERPGSLALHEDVWGRGAFVKEEREKPAIFGFVPRRYYRFGLARRIFQDFLEQEGPFDYALVQTVMSYWYPGVQEVIQDIRKADPKTKIILGGVYATLCPHHARSLGADFVLHGTDLRPLWKFLAMQPDLGQLPFWEGYGSLKTGVLKLADGCPFRCTYCSVPQVYPAFAARPLERSLAELAYLVECGAQNIAFYDDALLYQSEAILEPFLKEVIQRRWKIAMHLPNAVNARFISQPLADRMVEAGFKTFFLGFESSAIAWQRKTGGKVYCADLKRAVENLLRAGADPRYLTAYLILGHPDAEHQGIEESMRFAHGLGLRIMLSDFSPIPGTPDGEKCRRWVDLEEPLWHNKTTFPILRLGYGEVKRLKELCRGLNQRLRSSESMIESAAERPTIEPSRRGAREAEWDGLLNR